MKPWNEYNPDMPYPSVIEWKRQKRREIDNTPLTTTDRNSASDALPEAASNWHKEAVKLSNEEKDRREKEFFYDCRLDLGYHQFLTPDGILKMEAKAKEEGHEGGWKGIYKKLDEMTEFLLVMKKYMIPS